MPKLYNSQKVPQNLELRASGGLLHVYTSLQVVRVLCNYSALIYITWTSRSQLSICRTAEFLAFYVISDLLI